MVRLSRRGLYNSDGHVGDERLGVVVSCGFPMEVQGGARGLLRVNVRSMISFLAAKVLYHVI